MRTAVLAISTFAALLFGQSLALASDHGSADSVRVCDSIGCRYLGSAPVERHAKAQKASPRSATRVVAGKTFQQTPNVVSYHSDASRWISAARQHIGKTGEQLGMKWSRGNGRKSLWCGEFVGRIADATGLRKPANPDLAGNWTMGRRISGPQPGAIALISWRGKHIGHVGIVTGVGSDGDPIIISGNHNNRVVETAYPRQRVVAYYMPSG